MRLVELLHDGDDFCYHDWIACQAFKTLFTLRMSLLLCRTRRVSPVCSSFVGLCSSSESAVSMNVAVVNEVQSILTTSTSVESSLEDLVPFLSRSVVDSVISESPTFELGFRFYVWAMRRKRLRSWVSRNLIIKSLSESFGYFNVAWNLLQQLHESNEKIAAQGFDVLISAYSACGNAEKAVESFGRMGEFHCRPNTFTYNTVIRILVDQNFIELAMAVYNQMLKLKEWPNRSTYGLLIHGLFKAGKKSDALRLLAEMAQKGIAPNRMIYTILISSHCKANCLSDAYELFLHMKEMGCVHDAVSRNMLVHGFCKSGRVDEALAIISDEGFELGLVDYSCLIDGLFSVGRFEEACKYYEEMLGKNIFPDFVMYTIMIKGHSKAKRINEAFGFLNEMTSKGFVPDTFCYNTLIKGACDMGLLDDAKSLKLEISDQGNFPDSATYTIMISGLCKQGMIKAAKEIFEEMEKLGCLPTVTTFNALIDGLCKAGFIDSARLLFYKLEMGRNPCLYLRLSQGSDPIKDIERLRAHVQHLCESGCIVEAYKLLKELANSGATPDLVTYNILISCLCKNGDIKGAVNFIRKEMQLSGYSPDVITYGTIIHGLCRAERVNDAIYLFKKMKANGITPSRSIYNMLMLALSKKKQPWQVLTLWMDSIPKSISGIAPLVQKHFELGSREGVRILVEKELELKCLDNAPYCIMIIAFCRAGKVDIALDIYDVLNVHGIDITRRSCMSLVTHLCHEGKAELAMNVFFYGLDRGYFMLPHVCNLLISHLCYKKKRRSAGMVAYKLILFGYNEDALLGQHTRALLYGDSQA